MKTFDTKKYFLFAIPSIIIYRVIAYFTIDAMIGSIIGRYINFVITMAILMGCVFLCKKKPEDELE